MRDHHHISAGVADREGADARDAGEIYRRNRVAQQLIGGPVRQRHAIMRPPLKIVGHGFDQMVGREDLALLVKNQRREADSGERFAGDARPFKLEAR